MHFVSIPRPDDEIVVMMEVYLFYMVVSLQLCYITVKFGPFTDFMNCL